MDSSLGDDRRTRRTRRLLREALVELMLEKRYDSITVQDILERADVGRSTFYAHYRDKEDLFVRDFQSLLDGLGHDSHHAVLGGDMRVVADLFRHTQEQHRLYKALLRGRGIDVLFKSAMEYLSEKIAGEAKSHLRGTATANVPLPVLANYASGALLTLLKWWLDNDMPYSPERMAEMYGQLVMPGVRGVLQTAETKPTSVRSNPGSH